MPLKQMAHALYRAVSLLRQGVAPASPKRQPGGAACRWPGACGAIRAGAEYDL